MDALTLAKPKLENSAASKNEEQKLPHNIEAEAAILGAILLDNEILNDVDEHLRPEHFYEPVNQKIYTAILKFHDKGQAATPLTLKHYFDNDVDFIELGGGEFLSTLASNAIAVVNPVEYSKTIYELALNRSLMGVGQEIVANSVSGDTSKSAMDHVEAAEQKLFNIAEDGLKEKSFQPFNITLKNTLERAEKAYRNSESVVGVSTGLLDLDKMLGGMQESDLIILAGRPSMGKTALATNIAYNAAEFFGQQAKNNPDAKMKSVGFFSLEMSAEQLATRILSSECEINSSKITRGEMNDSDFAKLATESQKLNDIAFHIDDTPALSIAGLRSRARRLKRTHNLGFLVIDYLQLVRGTSAQAAANRVQEISEITQGLKAIAKELDIPVMALSQLSRAVEARDDKRPQLADLRESGSIEQDADVVMFVFREEYYVARTKPQEESPNFIEWQEKMDKVFGLGEVIIAKQRNGPIGNVTLQFKSNFTRFDNYIDPSHMPEAHF